MLSWTTLICVNIFSFYFSFFPPIFQIEVVPQNSIATTENKKLDVQQNIRLLSVDRFIYFWVKFSKILVSMKLLQSSSTEELAEEFQLLKNFDLKIVFTRNDHCFSQRKLPEKNYKPSKNIFAHVLQCMSCIKASNVLSVQSGKYPGSQSSHCPENSWK